MRTKHGCSAERNPGSCLVVVLLERLIAVGNMASKVQLCPRCWDSLHLFVPVVVENNGF